MFNSKRAIQVNIQTIRTFTKLRHALLDNENLRVKIVREEFAKSNDFAQKITYKTTGKKPEDLIAEFRNSYNLRIAVTVDMIATGTDIKPLEIVMFMRSVKSRGYFDQMKGRGVRVINDDDLQSVTSDAKTKDHYIIVDAVGVCEREINQTQNLWTGKNQSLLKSFSKR